MCFCIFLGFSKDENGSFGHRIYQTRAKPLFLWEHPEQITDVAPQNKLLLCSETITPSLFACSGGCLTFSFSSQAEFVDIIKSATVKSSA